MPVLLTKEDTRTRQALWYWIAYQAPCVLLGFGLSASYTLDSSHRITQPLLRVQPILDLLLLLSGMHGNKIMKDGSVVSV